MKKDNPALLSVAASLNIPPDWLYNLIKFESNWNPKAKSGMPYNKSKLDSGVDTVPKYARGLLQFIDSTAQSLGYKNSLDLVTKNPTIEGQLFFPVLKYLKQFQPFPTKQSLYMSVFYPVARKWPESREFPPYVQSANPNIRTVGDYVRKIDSVSSTLINKGVLTILIVAGIIIITRKK